MAAAYGADAVYLAGTTFGMRSFAGNFTPEALKEAVELCHRRGIRVHVTCNTMPRNNEVARLPEWLEYPAILAIWGRKRAGEEQPLVWDWSDKPGKGTLVVLLAGNVFLGTAFGPVWELLQQGIALF